MSAVTVDYKVMAHPSRRRGARMLAVRLGGRVVYDPDPSGVPSAHRTSLHAWGQRWPRRASHRLVVQDDAVLCTNFTRAVEHVLSIHPDALVAFFVSMAQPGGYYRNRDVHRCHRYTTLPLQYCVPTVCLAMPRHHAEAYTEWARDHVAPDYRCDDQALRMWRQTYTARIPKAIATIPCLANHGEDGPSLLDHQHDYGRQAVCWIGAWDPLMLDWTSA